MTGKLTRVQTVLATPDDIHVPVPVDFVLAFWMVHEVKDIPQFFRQVAAILPRNGKMLYIEPRMHVSQARFLEIIEHAKAAGFAAEQGPKTGLSRAVILIRGV